MASTTSLADSRIPTVPTVFAIYQPPGHDDKLLDRCYDHIGWVPGLNTCTKISKNSRQEWRRFLGIAACLDCSRACIGRTPHRPCTTWQSTASHHPSGTCSTGWCPRGYPRTAAQPPPSGAVQLPLPRMHV